MSARVPRRQHVVGSVHSRSDVSQRRSRGIGRRWMHVRTSTSMRAADSSSSRCPTAIITGASGPPAVAHAYTCAHNGRCCCVRLGTLEQHSTRPVGPQPNPQIVLLVCFCMLSSEYCGGAVRTSLGSSVAADSPAWRRGSHCGWQVFSTRTARRLGFSSAHARSVACVDIRCILRVATRESSAL